MSTIHPDKQLKLNIPTLSEQAGAASTSRPASPTSPQAKARRPSLTLPGLPVKQTPEAVPAAQRALTQPALPKLGALKPAAQAARAQSTGAINKIEGPSPLATFQDLRGALPDAEGAASHVSTAKAMAIVIQTGTEGLKTAFAYDDQGHIALGSHDELEQTKSSSTQHAALLQRMGRSIMFDKSLDADAKQFGDKLFRATMSRGSQPAHGITRGGTRLMQQEDGSLKFTVSDSFGFNNVTPEILEPVAQFHANVLRLSGLAHKEIHGDGDATNALAKRVTELLA